MSSIVTPDYLWRARRVAVVSAMQAALTEIQRIPTSGARAVAAFTVAGRQLLAIPQLARDSTRSPPGMNGGDSDTDLLLLQSAGGRFEPWSALPAPGGEDAEFFTIGGRSFLAVASIRTGSGPYELAAESQIFAWDRGPVRAVPERGHVRGQAVEALDHRRAAFPRAGPGRRPPRGRGPQPRFGRLRVGWLVVRPQQQIPSRWAYNWHPFWIGDEFFVAHADHAGASVLYRWDGTRLRPHQALAARGRPRVRDLRRWRDQLPRRRLHLGPDHGDALGRRPVHPRPDARRPGRAGARGRARAAASSWSSGSTSSSARPRTPARSSTRRSTPGTVRRSGSSPSSRRAAARMSRCCAGGAAASSWSCPTR